MKIVLKDCIVIAIHNDAQDLCGVSGYRGCLILAVPDGTPVEIGQTWEVTLEQAVAAREIEAADACQAVLDPLAARFPGHETKTWEKQKAEAEAILAGDTDQTIEKYPTIGGIIAVTGEAWGAFAMAVDANNQRWTAVVANVAGQRQRFVAAIKAVAAKDGATVADVLAVDMTITLPG
jgi:hypothetical protein